MGNFKHIMMDLETRGTVPGCVGFSIGAVVMNFETGELEDEFYVVIDIADCLESFLEQDPDTIAWWDKQSPEAREALVHALSGEATPLVQALESWEAWLSGIGASMRKTRLYGNGADFDNPILRVMQKAANIQPFGSREGFYGGRCYRTLKTLDELFGPTFAFNKLERSGTYHNALDDAKTQARHLMDNVRRIRSFAKYFPDTGEQLWKTDTKTSAIPRHTAQEPYSAPDGRITNPLRLRMRGARRRST